MSFDDLMAEVGGYADSDVKRCYDLLVATDEYPPNARSILRALPAVPGERFSLRRQDPLEMVDAWVWGLSSLPRNISKRPCAVALALAQEHGVYPYVLPLADVPWRDHVMSYARLYTSPDEEMSLVFQQAAALAHRIDRSPSYEQSVVDRSTRILTLRMSFSVGKTLAEMNGQSSSYLEDDVILGEHAAEALSACWWTARVVVNPDVGSITWNAHPWPWEVE